jgi:hypothetical protein
MPKMNLGSGSLRDHILQVAEQASAGGTDPARRVYVDFYTNVHYFKGSEGNAAPYRIGDADYSTTVKATSGLISFWQMGEPSGAKAYDTQSVANINLSGTYIRGVTGGVVNDPAKPATYFGGNAFGSATSASYHPGNVFSIELWFQRTTVGTEQTLVDAGAAGDYRLEFQADNTIRLFKAGTGNDFTTTATYTDTNWHHLVVTHNGTATHMYVDGVDKNGTAALKTMVASGTAFFVGETNDGTSRFNGSLQAVAFYNVALTGAQALAHYNDGVTVVPDSITHDVDYNSAVASVYVQGATGATSGWVNNANNPYLANTVIDRSDADTVAKQFAIGSAYLARDGAPVELITFSVTGFDGWRAGQTVTIDDLNLGIAGSYEIRDIQMSSPAGNGIFTYDISVNAMPWRGHFDIKRKARNAVGAPTSV